MYIIGVDIGGTKCAVSLGKAVNEEIHILHKCEERKTKTYVPEKMLEALANDILYCKGLLKEDELIQGIGISCGGPLNSQRGVILSPPNLAGWDAIPITEYFKNKTGLDAWLCNDANACALAEWKLGAGRGCSNMIFMTFGTGLGAGMILNNQLYTGANDMAGELGHIRLNDYGPVGYGKMGSYEGFCSGGGITQLAKIMIMEELQKGNKPVLCPNYQGLEYITTASIGEAAKHGDLLAKAILKKVGIQLGKGLSIVIDLLNPERIVIGGVFARCYDDIWPWANHIIIEETLPESRKVCKVVPSYLSESIGDIASLMVAEYHIKHEKETR